MPTPDPPPEADRRLDDPAAVDDIVASAASRLRWQPATKSAPRPAPGGNGQHAVADPSPSEDTPSEITPSGPPHAADPAIAAAGRVEGLPVGEPDADAPDDHGPVVTKHATRSLLEWLLVLGLAVLAVAVASALLVRPYTISSSSMTPTLDPGDQVLVSRLSYDLGDVGRGDIVVVDRSAVEGEVDDGALIKRVIGLPGERISIENSEVVVNGETLAEPYLVADVDYPNMAETIVPRDQVFVLGDNRADSLDSRLFGPVPVEDLEGRAVVRIWPLGSAGSL